jgi:uncharacterized protein (DUF433 family)
MAQREISAKNILRDIRSGLSDEELMEKYSLSPVALKALFGEMIAAGLLERSKDGSVTPAVKRIEVGKIVKDVLAGRTAHELINDYGLSATQFRDLSRQLVESKHLRRDQLGPELLARMDAPVPTEIRSEIRETVDFDVDVFEPERPNIVGKVLEVSTRGLRITGISATPDEIKRLRIGGDVLGQHESFQFEAQCRWTGGALESKDFVGGYMIVNISEKDSQELAKLIALSGMRTPVNDGTQGYTGDRSTEPAVEGRGKSRAKAKESAEAKKKVGSNELLADIRAGMDDSSLMEKYGLSSRRVLQAMNRLIWHGLMSPAELADRRSLAKTVYTPVFKCRQCGDITFTKTEKCPKCGTNLKSLNEKKPFG